MNKLRLQLEDLAVESFDTTQAVRRKGTVVGQQCTCYTNCTCPGCPSCGFTCDGTCPGDLTCDVTCWYTCDDKTCESCDCGSGGCGSVGEESCTCP